MMTTPSLPLSIMKNWSPEQKLAVYDLCQVISEFLWHHDRDALLEAMIRDDRDRGIDHTCDLDDHNLQLPFDDELPF